MSQVSAKAGSAKKGSTKKEVDKKAAPKHAAKKVSVVQSNTPKPIASAVFTSFTFPGRAKPHPIRGRRVWVFDPPEGGGYSNDTEITICQGICGERINLRPEMYMVDFPEGKFNYITREIFTTLKDATFALEKLRPGTARELAQAKTMTTSSTKRKKPSSTKTEPRTPSKSNNSTRSVYSPLVSAKKPAAKRARDQAGKQKSRGKGVKLD
jgi:hypothetical protein